MKKKYLRKFIALFDCLTDAGNVLSGRYDANPEKKEMIGSRVSSAYSVNRNILNDPGKEFLTKVFDEINDNLYEYSLNQAEYVRDLLRGFMNITRWLDYTSWIEWEGDTYYCRVDEKYTSASHRAALNLLFGMLERDPGDKLTEFEEYIVSCSSLLDVLAHFLDGRCLHFNMDLISIQNELGISILGARDLEGLVRAGYPDKVMQLLQSGEESQKALLESQPPEAETMLTFPEYLRHKKANELAAVCKKIFNAKQSPKAYAIMLSLLAEHQLIYLAEKQRRDFFESWYNYIGRHIPKNGNFYSINKHIDSNMNFQFINDTDALYVNLERKFDHALWKLDE
jgi:hypothetical protein